MQNASLGEIWNQVNELSMIDLFHSKIQRWHSLINEK